MARRTSPHRHILLANGLKAEYVTRTIGNNADQFAFNVHDPMQRLRRKGLEESP